MAKYLVAAGAALVVVLVAAGRFADSRFEQWRERVREANQYAGEQLARADAAEQAAAELHARADSLARAAEHVDTVLRERVRIVRSEPIPAPCARVVAERDAVIDSLLEHVDRWEHAYRTERGAYLSLFEAYANARRAADTLRAVIAQMPHARSRWLPRLGAGPFAGVCTSGQLCGGFGLSLSWEIP